MVIDNLPVALVVVAILFAILWEVIQTSVSYALAAAAGPQFRATLELTDTGLVLVLDNTGSRAAFNVAAHWWPQTYSTGAIASVPLLVQGRSLRWPVTVPERPQRPDLEAGSPVAALRVTYSTSFGPSAGRSADVPVFLPEGMRTT